MRRMALALLRAIGRMGSTSLYSRISACLPKALKARVHRSLLSAAAGPQTTLVFPAGARDSQGEPASTPMPQAVAVPQEVLQGHGVNLIGYVRGGLGLAENVRSFARALRARRFPMALIDANVLEESRNTDDSLAPDTERDAQHEIDVFFVNPDQLRDAIQAVRGSDAHYRIGYWFWELEEIPEQWLPSIDLVDEIWVSSEFVKAAFAKVTDKPITLIPMAVEVDTSQLSGVKRGESEAGPFTFLFNFDFHSYVERKNPCALIDAFRLAFPAERSDVRLIIKSINGELFRRQYYQLLSRAAEDRRIVVSDGFVSRHQMLELVNGVDAYVSLHRSEGFGLGLAESMYLGKAVIGTGYSGNLEFMKSDNSCLVDFSMTRLRQGDYVYGEGQYWANPNIEDAARYMRKLADEPEFGSALGHRAAEYMRLHHSHKQSSDVAIRRLQQIQRKLGLEVAVAEKIGEQ
ncbi:glycosyltransferase family 4 protein [Dyella silvae]|uniref:glycosyltransferase family 4 protein n=1 Tax=Dyella silvae TaxID=2994424 RepID=UPI0022648DAB|nr:glycosyltransferase family 4 protein [Dyella silvae]